MLPSPGSLVCQVLAALATLLVAGASVRAQGTTGIRDSSAAAISHVLVRRSDVFDSTDLHLWYARATNRFHVVTREARIRRELLLGPGDAYDSTRALESERNLRRLGVFGAVRVDSVRTADGLALRVRTQDAWSTIPYFSIGSSGDQAVWSLGFTEANLLGTATTFSMSYAKNPDRTAFGVGYGAQRLIADRIGLGVSWLELSDGRSGAASISEPFFSVRSPRGWSLYGGTFDGRVLRFRGGSGDAVEELDRRFDIARTNAAWAVRTSNRGYVRVGANLQLRRDDYLPEQSSADMTRTVTAAMTPFVAMGRPRYVVTRDFRALGVDEDIDLGLGVFLGAAIAPSAWGYERTGVGPEASVSVGVPIGTGFALGGASFNGLYSGGALDSGTVAARVTTVLHPRTWHALVIHGSVGRKWNPHPGAEYDLGLLTGPRAFPSHAFTGDRSYFTMAEYRWTPWHGVLRVMDIGMAGFVDHGGAWFGDEARRTGTDFGAGLRLASTRLGNGPAMRLDLAWRVANDVEPAGAVFSIGAGFPFDGR